MTRVPLPWQRLALRVLRGDVEAGLVLADALQEARRDSIQTGRTRPIRFSGIAQHSVRPGEAGVEQTFFVRGVETIYNLEIYKGPSLHLRFPQIRRQWQTSRRDIFRAARRAGIIPRDLGFNDLRWTNLTMLAADWGSDLAYQISAVQPAMRGSSQRTRRALIATLWSRERQSWHLDETDGLISDDPLRAPSRAR